MYEPGLAVERIRAARAAIDAIDPAVMLVGRNENFRVPGMSVSDSIERAVAYAEAGADCLFVPFILDRGAVAELVAAVAPKPVNVVVHDYDDSIRAFAALGVRRCSVGGSLARRSTRRSKPLRSMRAMQSRSPRARRPRTRHNRFTATCQRVAGRTKRQKRSLSLVDLAMRTEFGLSKVEHLAED